MRKMLFLFGLFLSVGLYAQKQSPFQIDENCKPACDTLINEQVYISQHTIKGTVCVRWDGSQWVEREDCENVVPGNCTTCKQTSECYGGRSTAVSATLTDGTVIAVQDLLTDGIPNSVNDLGETLVSLYGGSYTTSTGEEDGLCGLGTSLDAFIFANLNAQIDYITLSTGVIDVQQRGDCTFNYTCADCNTCSRTCYVAGVEDRTYFELLLGIGGGSTQLDILGCLGTSSANFTFQQAQIRDCIETLTGADFVSVERLSDLIFEIRICGMPEGAAAPLWVGGERENVRFNQAEEEEKGETVHLDRCTVEEIKPEPPFSTVITDACSKGVKISVTIGYDSQGNVLWYKDEDGNTIESPDFQAECPPLTCENTTELFCAEEDNAALGISIGDELMVTLKLCSDGTSSILSAAFLSDLNSTFNLPAGFDLGVCSNGSSASVVRCVIDEDGTRWREILINSSTGPNIVYQNEDDGTYGTPNGEIADCNAPVTTIVSSIDGKHCIQVGETEFKAFLFVNSDKTICAKPVGGTAVYQEGEYTLVSCCPSDAVVETVHLAGFTVTRPTDTPNVGWNNEKTTASAPLIGDFELCFTVTAATPNTPQMIGITADPTANANYNTIDHALYLYNANTSFLLREYNNGAFIVNYNSANWIGSEICFQRIGGDLYYKQNGVVVNPSAPCAVGTGTVYLDDSFYYNPGFWGAGSITFSDFVLRQAGDDDIKSVDECCCEANSGGGVNVSADFGASFPISASAGDRFYNTTLREEFRFDAALARWTGEVRTDGFGDSGAIGSNQQLRRFNGMASGPDRGIFFPYDILVTDVSYNWETPNSSNGTVQLKAGAAIVHSLGWAGADEASATNLSVIIPANTVINAQLGILSANVNNSQYVFTYRRLE